MTNLGFHFDSGVSAAGLYAIYLEFLLLLYAVVPLPLYGTLAIGEIK